MTRAEEIRSMSDEELAKVFIAGCMDRDCPAEPDGKLVALFDPDEACGSCYNCWLSWLKEKVPNT